MCTGCGLVLLVPVNSLTTFDRRLLGKSPNTILALAARDQDLNALCEFIRVLGRVGVGFTIFTWEPGTCDCVYAQCWRLVGVLCGVIRRLLEYTYGGYSRYVSTLCYCSAVLEHNKASRQSTHILV